jgi:hypothetical protein
MEAAALSLVRGPAPSPPAVWVLPHVAAANARDTPVALQEG